MKKLLLIIVCLFSLSVSAQQYYPMLDSVNVWTYTGNQPPVLIQNTPDFPCSYPFWGSPGSNMYTTTDTVINSVTYKILNENNENCEYGYIREDTAARKVYFADVNSNPEILLYDFSMQIGDTINISFLSENYFSSGNYTLDSIRNIIINAGVRHIFYLNCHLCPGSPTLSWVESVGNLGDVIYPYSSNYFGCCLFSCQGFPHDFAYFVTCFDHNQIIYYDSCAYNFAASNSCFAVWDTCDYYDICGGINELNYSRFYISPNPAHDHFTITSNFELPTSNLEIYNMFGQKVYKEAINRKQQTVNCKLNGGVYFVKLEDGQKRYVQKLIIE